MTRIIKTVRKITNTPKLRFAGFSGAWEEKKLGDVATINPTNEHLSNEFVYIDLESVEKGILKQENKIKKENAPSRAQRVLEKGDILFQMVRPYQQNNLFFNLGGNFVASTGYAQIRTKQDPMFIYQYLHTENFLNKVAVRCTGSNYPAINSSDFKKIKINLPALPEQQKIADFLGATDTWIGNLRAQKENLESYKKGIMQKLFSQEIRFKDEKGKAFPKWEEKKLGELGELVGGGTPATTKSEFWKGTIPWISSSDLEDGSIYKINTHRFITENAIKNSATHKIPAKSILVVSRVGVGKMAITDIDVCTSQDFQNITPFQDKADAVFLAYYLSVKVNELLQYNQGTSIKGFTKKDLQNLCLNIPVLSEQQKIADFLTSVDKVIESKQQQITQAETWKKGLMQGLFV